MKKIHLFFIVFAGVLQTSYAQHSVMSFSDEYVEFNQRTILIVPFEPIMYHSDINRELYKENQMESREICENFSKGIDQSFRSVFKDRCNVNSFYYLDETQRYRDLSFVFQNRGLEYVVRENEENKRSQVKKLFSRKEANNSKEGIYNGQVVSVEENKKKYMKAVANELLIDSLRRQFQTDFILFVNQLDIKNIYGSVYEMANMEYNRKVDLHYTLYSSNGEILSTGVSSTKFPATENDIDVIIGDYFPVLAQNIYDDLFKVGLN